MYYARLLRGDFAELFMEGGPLRWLVDYIKEHPIVSSIVRNFPSGSHRTKLHYAWLRYAEESLS